ncbi:serine carboxypeptidase-like protein 50 [Tanacetum coccineum]
MGSCNKHKNEDLRHVRISNIVVGLLKSRRPTSYQTTKVTSFLLDNEIKKTLKANESLVYEACSQVVWSALHEDLMKSVRNEVVFGSGHLVPADQAVNLQVMIEDWVLENGLFVSEKMIETLTRNSSQL